MKFMVTSIHHYAGRIIIRAVNDKNVPCQVEIEVTKGPKTAETINGILTQYYCKTDNEYLEEL